MSKVESFNDGCCAVCVHCIEDVVKSFLKWQWEHTTPNVGPTGNDRDLVAEVAACYIHDLQEAQL